MAIIGIDLGTTNSLATVWREGKSVMIPNALGTYLTPSVVSVGEDGSIVTGESAKQRLISHPEMTASLFKQHMGSPKTYTLGGMSFRPEDLSAMILRALKSDAEAYLGEAVSEAIISVPAYFNDTQRSATKMAGQLAGMHVERILNEPSAAALAYRQYDVRDGTSLVFDFGGGTLDISILEAFDNIVDILAVSGDNHLGGSDVDEAIMEMFIRENPGLDGLLSAGQKGVLLKTAEACKMGLTDRPVVYMSYRHDGQDYTMTIDNEKLTQICAPILLKFKDIIRRALQNAEHTMLMIDHVILVGGSCRMPLVSEYLRQLTGKPVLCDIDPDMAVAQGVGLAAGIKERAEDVRDMVLTDICPFSLGVSARRGEKDDVFSSIIPRNTALPASRMMQYYTVSDNQTTVRFKIYQGESLEASKNLLLGECEVIVPPLPKGEASVSARFTYDINGILDCDFMSDQSGETFRKLIISNQSLAGQELEARLRNLSKLKASPPGDEENKLIVAHGERLYEEFPGEMQERIAYLLLRFETELKKANPARIAKTRAVLQDYFARLDAYAENLLFFGRADEDTLGYMDDEAWGYLDDDTQE